uniref:Uncharacterized protein n=1 Tax=Marophrys sp. SRT127 TaxID=2488311 RepID=A0A455RGL2_9EUKA|nr:hypothetical protein [Marophrys sp. SRT127]
MNEIFDWTPAPFAFEARNPTKPLRATEPPLSRVYVFVLARKFPKQKETAIVSRLGCLNWTEHSAHFPSLCPSESSFASTTVTEMSKQQQLQTRIKFMHTTGTDRKFQTKKKIKTRASLDAPSAALFRCDGGSRLPFFFGFWVLPLVVVLARRRRRWQKAELFNTPRRSWCSCPFCL